MLTPKLLESLWMPLERQLQLRDPTEDLPECPLEAPQELQKEEGRLETSTALPVIPLSNPLESTERYAEDCT
eukprot:1777056-Pyramimonas_sp.AAC.1